TMVRGAQKIGGWLAPRRRAAVQGPAHLHVVNPWMWPWFAKRFDRRLNRALLLRQLTPLVKSLAAPPIVVTTLPITAELMGRLPVARWVYYCVDDFSQWPGLDQRTLAEMEEQLVREADVLIAVSETLQERFQRMGRESQILTHGVDLDHWQAAGKGASPVAGDAWEKPWVVFWGLVDERIDVELVRRTAQRLKRGTVLLVGPEQDADAALSGMPRVARVPAVDYGELPALAHEAAVLIMPYADLPITRAMQPLKLKEYLATRKPAVVRDLPAVREWSDCLDVAETPDQFAEAVERRLVEGLSPGQRIARTRLAGEGWTAKARRFEALLVGPASEVHVRHTLAVDLELGNTCPLP
ncbi:MAG TPA: glycosyltransferase, partial [Pirellulales bacterium]|nr:glycosyltransferase [Pirellulales bacterium]